MPTFDATFDAREQINEKLPTNGDDGFGATALAVMPCCRTGNAAFWGYIHAIIAIV
jgi:hypothetical protein